MPQDTPSPRGLRWIAIVWGVIFLLWLPFEDLGVQSVGLLAAALCFLMAFSFLNRNQSPQNNLIMRYSITGIIAGLTTAPLAVALMAFKSGAHGHTLPDFTPDQMLTILRRAPVWSMSGLLIGLGSGWWRLSRQK